MSANDAIDSVAVDVPVAYGVGETFQQWMPPRIFVTRVIKCSALSLFIFGLATVAAGFAQSFIAFNDYYSLVVGGSALHSGTLLWRATTLSTSFAYFAATLASMFGVVVAVAGIMAESNRVATLESISGCSTGGVIFLADGDIRTYEWPHLPWLTDDDFFINDDPFLGDDDTPFIGASMCDNNGGCFCYTHAHECIPLDNLASCSLPYFTSHLLALSIAALACMSAALFVFPFTLSLSCIAVSGIAAQPTAEAVAVEPSQAVEVSDIELATAHQGVDGRQQTHDAELLSLTASHSTLPVAIVCSTPPSHAIPLTQYDSV